MSKKQKAKTESRPPGTKLLIDTISVKFQIVESGDDKQLKVRGEFGRAGIKTENNRVYPNKLIERELGRLAGGLKERKVLGELDHPADGKTQLARVSHLITDLRLEDSVVVGEAEPLDTERGQTLQALLKSGVKLGVSSRGFGSVKTNSKGEDIVQEDYKLLTYDFVAEPADQTAYPEVVYEEEDEHMPDLTKLTVEELREHAPALVEDLTKVMTKEREAELAAEWAEKLETAKTETKESARMSLKEEFTKELVESIANTKEEIREAVRSEFLADPEVAAAKTVIEELKGMLRPFILPEDAETVVTAKDEEIASLKAQLAERDGAVSRLEGEVSKLANVAKEVGYKYYLEQLIDQDNDAELMRKLVGDVKQYPDAAAIAAKVEAMRSDLKAKAAKAAAKNEEIVALEDRVKKLADALEETLETNKALEEQQQQAEAQLHAEKRLTNHPRRDRIQKILESIKPTSKGAVDEVVENFREPDQDPSDLEAVRARVRRLTGGGRGPTALEEELPAPKSTQVTERTEYNHLGASLGELQTLAGIRPKN